MDNECVVRLQSTHNSPSQSTGGLYGDVRMLYTPLRDGVGAEAIDIMLTAIETAVERVSSVTTDTVPAGQILTSEHAMTLLPFVVGIRRMFNVAHQWLVDTPTLLTAVVANCLTNEVGVGYGSGLSASTSIGASSGVTGGASSGVTGGVMGGMSGGVNLRVSSMMSLEQVMVITLSLVLLSVLDFSSPLPPHHSPRPVHHPPHLSPNHT